MAQSKLKVHFVLEGNEEETLFELLEYFYKGINLEITYINCGGYGNIAPFYYDAYSSENYDLVLCVYDVDYDYEPSDSPFNQIRTELGRILGNDKRVNNISLCNNPNGLLIILLGYDTVDKFQNMHKGKSKNTDLIHKYCEKIGNKKKYDASDWQLNLLKQDYYDGKASFKKILENQNEISEKYQSKNISSNIIPFIRAILDDNVEYFNQIIKKISN